jgi:hypothetical protein
LNRRTTETLGLSVKGWLETAQKVVYEVKEIHSTEAEISKGGREYGAGEGKFPSERPKVCNRGD